MGTWILSKEYTNKNIFHAFKIKANAKYMVNNLKSKISDRYFILESNERLIYNSFWGERTEEDFQNSRWSLNSGNINLVIPYYTNYYEVQDVDREIFKKVKATSKIVLNFSKIDGKLLLWKYYGDPDRESYIVYEKKRIKK